MELTKENYKLEGSSLEIITYPNPVLTKVAEDVEVFDDELKSLCRDMLYTMYHAPGIGLAAPQIGISKRIFVLDVDYEKKEIEEDSDQYSLYNFNPLILINPIIKDKKEEIVYQEGCLSLPGIYEDVKRAKDIVVDYKDLDGNEQTLEATDLLSICIQHENDHLDGIVFIERLSNFKKNFFKKKLIKESKK